MKKTRNMSIMSKMFLKNCLLAFVSLVIFSSGAFAAPVSIQMAEDVAGTHLRVNNERERLAVLKTRKVFDKRSMSIPDIVELKDTQTGETLAYVLGLKPKGFIVVSPDTDITPIIAYSFQGNFPFENFKDNVLLHMVKRDMGNRIEAIPVVSKALKTKNNDLWEKYQLAENSFIDKRVRATVYGPYLETTWDQGHPWKGGYNFYCPLDPIYWDLGYDYRSVVGCVATAMAQIINYHQYPSSVTFTSKDNYRSEMNPKDSLGTRVIYITATNANISSITYPASNDMIAKLSYACGVSVHMKYSAVASGTYTYNVATALKNKFGYASATAITPRTDLIGIPYDVDFYPRLQNNMKNRQPAQLAISSIESTTGKGGGHSIVCDGYSSSSGQYHLNYGWGSDDPADNTWWYSLPEGWDCIRPNGETYDNLIKYAVLDIIPSPSVPAAPTLTVTTSGTTATASWTAVSGATGYVLYYVPNPDTGPDSRGTINMGAQTTISVNLWPGAAFYVAVQAYNSAGGSSASNVEYFVISTPATGNLVFRVANSTDTRPLPGATVTVGNKSDTTGYDGYVTITGITAGEQLVTVSYLGKSASAYVDIVAGETAYYYWPLWWVD